MKYSQAASRYAKALFAIGHELGRQEKFLVELRAINQAFVTSDEAALTLSSPLISEKDTLSILSSALEGQAISDEVNNFIKLLVEKKRLEKFSQIVAAFEEEVDRSNNLARGTVKSPAPLGPNERKEIEGFISKVTKKKAILEYKEAPELIGGLTAHVGSYTFDDSLDTQLKLLQEHLTKGAN